MDLTQATKLDLLIAETQGEVKVTRLKTKHAPNSGRRARNKRAVSNQVGYEGIAVGKGSMGNLNPVGGIGKAQVSNLEGVVQNANRQYAEDRKAAARERAAERKAELLRKIDEELESL